MPLLGSDDGGERRQTRAVTSRLDDGAAVGGAKDEERQIPNKLRRLPGSREGGPPRTLSRLGFSSLEYRLLSDSRVIVHRNTAMVDIVDEPFRLMHGSGRLEHFDLAGVNRLKDR